MNLITIAELPLKSLHVCIIYVWCLKVVVVTLMDDSAIGNSVVPTFILVTNLTTGFILD